MEERTLRVLDFHVFLQILKTYASSDVGQGLCLLLRPSAAKEDIETLLAELAEGIDLLQTEGDLPFGGFQEIRPILPQAKAEGSCLSSEALLQIKDTLAAAGVVKRFLVDRATRHLLLQQKGEGLPDFDDFVEDLQSAIGLRGEILDSASEALRQIRKEIARIRNRIRNALDALWEQEELRNVFQEQIITLRNERYVVAVKAENKSKLPGIIHDQSQSKATFFIEPLSTVDDNNDLNMLLQDERQEERRILVELTSKVRKRTQDIHRAVEILGTLDVVFAKAKWAKASRATIPLLNNRGTLRLRAARHPLLGPQAVPIDLHLDEGQSTLILSGANTGGKTVALKTLGLLTLMTQSGIPIPAAEGSEVAVFSKMFADIGDDQSLQQHLSTFSAWIRAIATVLEEADAFSCVLLDEVGGGTDPTEGAALTMALMDELRARGTKTVVTTHIQLLKAYGAIHPDVVNVSVEFHPNTLRPTYQLIYGQPGESYGLYMAETWGLPRRLIDRAQTYLGDKDRQVGHLLERLAETRKEMEAKLQEAEILKKEAANTKHQAETLLGRIRKEEDALLARAREEAEGIVQQAKEDLRGLINDFKIKGRRDLHHLAQDIQAKEEKIHRWSKKKNLDRVSSSQLLTSDPRWRLSGIWEGEKQTGAFGVRSARHPSRPAGAKRGGFVQYEIPAASPELKVIGLRVEEALPLVDKAIDDAVLGGLKEVAVIHGGGTGRLRQAIRDHLREHHYVRTFLPGAPERGGDGVTVVEIGPAPHPQRPRRSGPKRS